MSLISQLEEESRLTILVCGFQDEAPIAMLVQSLRRKGADFVVIDQGKIARQVRLRWKLTDRGILGHIKVQGRVIDIKEIHSVYHRFTDPEESPITDTSLRVVNKTRSIMRSLMDLFDVLPIRVVNRRRPMMSNNSKPYQALLIRQTGFAIPETCITNDPDLLREFAFLYNPLIYKSISSVRSIVSSLDEKSASKMQSLQYLPTQFQRKIEGLNVRVHVVGRRAIATQILSSATDYRYAFQENTPAKFKKYELTMELRKRCIQITRISGLSFVGIDLLINPDKVYCLEINPSPGYSYYQEATGQPISEALADFLMTKKLSPSELKFPSMGKFHYFRLTNTKNM
jgi:glutathione synthase/RimK-type ligase-like ATP-grasp enzyme